MISLALNILYPIPLVFLLLLHIPFPSYYEHSFRKVVEHVTDSVVDFAVTFPVVAIKLRINTICTLSSAFFLLISTLRVVQSTLKRNNGISFEDFSKRQLYLMQNRLVVEKSFWLSLLSLVLWLCLCRIRNLMKQLDAQRSTLNEIQENSQE